MINKECFVASIKKIEDFREDQRKATKMLHNIFEMDGHSVLEFGSCLIDEIINLLSMSFDSGNNVKEMEDIEDWITWFLYEIGNDSKAWVNEKEYIIKNESDLYDLIIDWKKHQS